MSFDVDDSGVDTVIVIAISSFLNYSIKIFTMNFTSGNPEQLFYAEIQENY